jgi:hypothetical protein
MNLGQAELARAVNDAGRVAGDTLRCDARQVAKWESGSVSWPQARYRRALEAVTGLPCTALGFCQNSRLANEMGTVATTPDVEIDPVRRRDFLTVTTALATSVNLPEIEPLSKGDRPRAVERYLSETSQTLAQLDSLEKKFGSGTLLPLVEQQVSELTDLLDSNIEHLGVVSLAASAHELAAWMNYDAGDHGRARYLYREALYLAQIVNDKDLICRIAVGMSMQSCDLSRPVEAVRLSQMGQETHTNSARSLSVLAMREARGWAMLRAQREAETSVRRAMAVYDRESRIPEWASSSRSENSCQQRDVLPEN